MAQGGWYALEQASTAQLAAKNYQQISKHLEMNIIAAGGYAAVQALAADPKGALVQMIVNNNNNNNDPVLHMTPERLAAVVGLLHAQGKGFSSDLVDGEWISVLNVSSKTSPKRQKFVEKLEQKGQSFSNFNCKEGIFTGNAKLFFGQADLGSTVKFTPMAQNFDIIGKTIVLRRIACDIIGASWKVWKLPRIPLPLKIKGGFLDFTYLDHDIRITKGNRGGLFVHFRPTFWNKMIQTK